LVEAVAEDGSDGACVPAVALVAPLAWGVLVAVLKPVVLALAVPAVAAAATSARSVDVAASVGTDCCVAVASIATPGAGVLPLAPGVVAPFAVPSVLVCAGEPVSEAVVEEVAAIAAAAIASGALALAWDVVVVALAGVLTTASSAAIGFGVMAGLSPACVVVAAAVAPGSVASVVFLVPSLVLLSDDFPLSVFDVPDLVALLEAGCGLVLPWSAAVVAGCVGLDVEGLSAPAGGFGLAAPWLGGSELGLLSAVTAAAWLARGGGDGSGAGGSVLVGSDGSVLSTSAAKLLVSCDGSGRAGAGFGGAG
jgi:hypothetical protein